jgi:F0F1-type ATP synthase delta subunit
MADRNIARRYAQAFLAIAVEFELIDVFDADLGRVMEEFGAHEGLIFSTLSNPVFTREERVAVLE